MTPVRTPTPLLAHADHISPVAATERLKLPAGVMPFQFNWTYIFAIGAYHAVALLAFMPGYFSWSGLIVAVLGTHLCGLFGINLCYHRLLTQAV